MAKCSLSLRFPTTFLLLLLLVSLSLVWSGQSQATTETQVLLEFKRRLEDPSNHLGDWEDFPSPCNFSGVTCDRVSGAVTGINLQNLSLAGEIDPVVCELRRLNSLLLGQNALTGGVPPELSRCTALQFLNLSVNGLTGQLPDLSSLKNLLLLDLSTNKFVGKFPSWVGSLRGLVSLGLGEIQFDEGLIPESIGHLKNLNWLFLGSVISTISNLRNLCKIELYNNNFTGELPVELGRLTLLSEFDISKNGFTGKLPEEMGDLKNLTIFQLYQNNFWGELPKGFGDLELLTSFSIYGNAFWGEFPENLGRFSPLDTIDISENRFTGPFPRFLCQNRRLKFLLALDNNFSGEFPDTYGDCKTLLRFRISRNNLVGRIPDRVWGMPSAVVIDFSYNGFTGGISSHIGDSTSLNLLSLESNNFSGEIPAEIGKLSMLHKLFVSGNSFSGNIPPQIGSLDQLTSLHLEGNSLSGGIPSELGKCGSLVDLDLSSNSLSGEIPEALSSVASLNSLNLSQNRLTGSIPRGLEQLKLSSIDLSGNQLSGSVPPGLRTLHREEPWGICNLNNGRKDAMGNHLLIVALISLTLIAILAGFIFMSRRSFMHENARKESDLDDTKWRMERFHRTEFDAEEIRNLREENLIGSGGTGKVYRLDLKKGGGPVAVKQLWKGPEPKIWTAEMDILGKVKHRNIVKLYACVAKGSSNYLVLEYMPKGNLHEALRREAKGGKTELDWQRRHKIALGAAQGIMYLHHDCSPAIIHRDIKSTNILLEEDYEPKIADFGISRLAGDADSSRLAGTLGYMAPELAYSMKASERSDVYSFGVVLLELVTGRYSVEEEYGHGKDIVHWVLKHVGGGRAMEVLDPRVAGTDAHGMIKVLKVATLCTTKLPSLRPTMKEVVNMLIDASPRQAARCEI
ncbi:unnamed protein product [Spirodela intermedia]|uniref:non-specific serine/threonine protein kinase n=1 Tax=Spirodela intermedia TaxID=51605 RepID=A0A7I8IRI1_SPIIN|nr:unnamed protein product [Spirodela intermedia]CAA6660166.1 unnamed protein product [Spirodela intermedia]